MKLISSLAFRFLLFCLLPVSALAQSSACLGADTIRIVVIGSSTAAGTGASIPDSAWVNRYRNTVTSINSSNEVINLARGGYNTWLLMPDGFSPPIGRPQPDTLRNISHALRQNPDAIIINLPSNDAAIGTGVNEQMSNFIQMDSLAASFGVPVWVCTTQPRSLNTIGTQIQLGVRDSILSRFGSRALNFWAGTANSQHRIDSLYDSGDGVHVNDAGHRVLWQVAVQKAILDSLVQGYIGLDLKSQNLRWLNPSLCGSSASLMQLEIANLGTDSLTSTALVELIRENLQNGQFDTIRKLMFSQLGCSFNQVTFSLNTNDQQNWRLKGRVTSLQDAKPANNESSWIPVKTNQRPALITSDTTACSDDSLTLNAYSNDSIRWFDDALATVEINRGDSVVFSGSTADTLYLQAFRGPFYFLDELKGGQTSNILWNGCMFNLIAGADTVYWDSLQFTAGSTGDLQVNLRTHLGSYIGSENAPNLWSAPILDSIYGALTDSAYFLNFGQTKIAPGDTLACYLYLQNVNQRLAYQSAGSQKVYQGDGLSLELGSGIAANFGAIYNPRHLKANFYYHFGLNDKGQCQSEIVPLIIEKSAAQLQWGTDTVILNFLLANDTILKAPFGFSNALWQDSIRSDSFRLRAINLGPLNPGLWVSLSVTDSLGCLHHDSIFFSKTFFNTVDEFRYDVHVFPIPNRGAFFIDLKGHSNINLRVSDLSGRQVWAAKNARGRLKVKLDISEGIYILELSDGHHRQFIKLQKQ